MLGVMDRSKPTQRAQRAKEAVSAPRPERYQRTRAAHALEAAEDYVEIIAELIASHGEARVTEIAAWLGVSHVTVVRTVARLSKAGLLVSRPYRSVALTEKGADLAAHAKHRHNVVLRFLLKLGVPGEVAEEDAEGIEHHVSAATLAAMERFAARNR